MARRVELGTGATEVRLAAVSDLHFRRDSTGRLDSLFTSIRQQADILLLGGDIIDYGLPEEAQLFCRDLRSVVKGPVLAVLGNHEYESGHQAKVKEIFEDAGIVVLDGDSCEIDGIGFAGVKGFGGGFKPYALQAWGEAVIKQFAREAIVEANKLGSALGNLPGLPRVVLMHYSPIVATVVNEPKEIYTFLGSSRLEDPLNRHDVTAVFHGHAHHGSLEGRTLTDVPVYNVAMPLLKSAFPNSLPVRFLSVRRGTP